MFSSLFEPIENILHSVLSGLYFLTEQLGFGSYGLAIILLTVLIKILLYPLTVKQLKSMRAMQKIQPELKKLQEKYKDKPQIMQQKLMQLYQKEGVNPMAGCLPLLIQMPILMAMYYTLFNFNYGDVEPSFLWLPSLSQTDPLYILPVLSALTTFLQQKLSMTESTQQMKMMMTIMPLFIGFISLNFPAGLVLYWVTMNIVQIAQQFYMNKKEDKNSDKETITDGDDNRKKR
ncbi:MAG: YidC/Oxa1 family membrane protein insertase [Selenomonadaceae bacterium]|nr:YidC/Oxa1 family membrane protein insertase [Selenomonadaceae bacterium]